MLPCEVCGSENFEKHAGFMYCSVCQTQSQNYYEQEYEYRDPKIDSFRRKKKIKPSTKTKKPDYCDDGMWTTWEAFNYILFGMKEEMKKCGVAKGFGKMVFKLWTAYLKECQAAFISRYQPKIPKLGLNFKPRDARILYNVHVPSNSFRRRRCVSESSKSATSFISNSGASTLTKRLITLQKVKVIQAEYKELLSTTVQSNSQLPDESCESMNDSESVMSSLKQMLKKEDYKVFKSSYPSERRLLRARITSKEGIRSPSKSKLLSIIHLALVMIGSQIQLCDLLRFIREGHLSFAKVTHFLPKHMKLPRNDFTYVEVTSDRLMPTHLQQRRVASKLAYLLRIERIPVPDMDRLVDRYCLELNLPDQLARLCKQMLRDNVPSDIVPKSCQLFPCYEAWAMVSIIFVMKLLFGINDRTEIFLSQLASEVNASKTGEESLFVFEEWQKYIECRKSVLSRYHYPTAERLAGSSCRNSKMFLDTMMRESKDEHRNERFVPYRDYYISEKILNKVKRVLKALSKPLEGTSLEFQPSLTPQTSHLEVIMADLNQDGGVSEKRGGRKLPEFTLSLLKQSFKKCDIQFAIAPKNYMEFLKEKNSDLLGKFNINQMPGNEGCAKNRSNVGILLECSSNYWTLKYPSMTSSRLTNFREEVLEKTPKNFQWLLSECAKILEMNMRDVYDELLIWEQKFSGEE